MPGLGRSPPSRSRGQRARRALVALLILVVTLGPAAGVAGAHAVLVRSDPSDNAVLEDAPRTLTLRFSEPVARELSSARVADSDGRSVAGATARVLSGDRRVMVVDLPRVGDGVYAVSWKVLSESDLHVVEGLVVFGVGATADPRAFAGPRNDVSPSPFEAALRWLDLCLLAGLVGGLAVAQIVLRPRESAAFAGASNPGAARARALAVVCFCAAGALVSGLALLALEVKTVGGKLLAGAPTTEVLARLLGDTSWGHLWIVREHVLLLALVCAVALRSRVTEGGDSRDRRWWGASGVLLLLSALCLVTARALSGHTGALGRDFVLAVSADALHVLAACVWVGGLAVLAVSVLPLLRRGLPASALRGYLLRFGAVAGACVGLLVVSGLYLAGRQVATPDALGSTLYGRALVVKTAMAALVGAVGLLTAAALRPGRVAGVARRLRLPVGSWSPELPALILVEVGAGLGVLLIAAFLTATPPARQAPGAAEAVRTSATVDADDLLVTFAAKPNRPGENIVTVLAASTRRPALGPIRDVAVRLRPAGRGVPVTLEPRSSEPGRYTFGGVLPSSGRWTAEVVVERGRSPATVGTVDWEVADPGPPGVGDEPGSLERPLSYVALGLLLGMAALVLVRAHVRRRPGSGAPLVAQPERETP